MTDETASSALCEMMAELYREDPPAAGQISEAHYRRTIQHLLTHPDQGQITLIQSGEVLCGYVLLIPYWSNEYGGTLLFVDELYVKPEWRNRGIGTAVLTQLQHDCPAGTIRICLEVSQRNLKARKLYESLGFIARPYTIMTLTPQSADGLRNVP